MDAADQVIQRAIANISQSDPLVKLVDQVRLGRMKATDAGLRAVTESWLANYHKIVESPGLTRYMLRRIDPNPRLAVLTEIGIVPADHPAVTALQSVFKQAMDKATE
ncbi:hypothetical protein [Petrachloros mirabilis]